MTPRPPRSTLFPYTTLFRSSTIEDVTFQKNLVRHSGSGVNILAADDPNPSQTMKRVAIRMFTPEPDRKSTRLNSSHRTISYAVFCLKKKKKNTTQPHHTSKP